MAHETACNALPRQELAFARNPQDKRGVIRTRFAPSPNGLLHLGHAYAAIVAHDLARARGGRIPAADRGHRRHPQPGGTGAGNSRRSGLAGAEWDGAAGVPVGAAGQLCRGRRAAEGDGPALSLPVHPRRGGRGGAEAGPDGPLYPGTCRGRGRSPKVRPGGSTWRGDGAGRPARLARRAGRGCSAPGPKCSATSCCCARKLRPATTSPRRSTMRRTASRW